MSDSFTCRVDVAGSSVRVNFEPDSENSNAAVTAALTQVAQPGQRSDAGTAELVRRFSLQLAPQAPSSSKTPPRVEVGDMALMCLGDVSGLALGVMGATALHPMLGAITAFKAGYDLGKCVALERNAALQAQADARAVAQCEARNGTPVGTVGGVMTCLVTQEAQP